MISLSARTMYESNCGDIYEGPAFGWGEAETRMLTNIYAERARREAEFARLWPKLRNEQRISRRLARKLARKMQRIEQAPAPKTELGKAIFNGMAAAMRVQGGGA